MIANDPIAGLDEGRIPFTIIPLESVGITRSAFDLHNNLEFTEGVLREVKQTLPDLIYQRYSRFTWAGVEASLMSGRPLFLEYNGSEVWVGKHWDDAGMFSLMERIERLNLNAAARIFVVSEVERRNLLKVGIPDQRIIVNPNGVDVERFHPGVGGEGERARLGAHPDEVLAGFIGTFGPWHGVLELATAITLTARENRIRFLLIGDGKLREPAERIISEAGMEDRVIFTGAVKHDRVPALLDACDILVSPHVPLADGSDFFGSPTKLFEYMAMGKGIVASRLGQIGEILKHNESALLVEPGNLRELAAGIEQLAASRELRQRLGERAIKEVVANYTWKHNAERVLSAYDSWRQQTTDEK
jgi:glycosyltransferase involved in cell wall biosynthesis